MPATTITVVHRRVDRSWTADGKALRGVQWLRTRCLELRQRVTIEVRQRVTVELRKRVTVELRQLGTAELKTMPLSCSILETVRGCATLCVGKLLEIQGLRTKERGSDGLRLRIPSQLKPQSSWNRKNMRVWIAELIV